MLFQRCLRHKQTVLGLYRTDHKTGFPYVYTLPSPDTLVHDNDQVYVMCDPPDLPPE
jgi:hypothetical protein